MKAEFTAIIETAPEGGYWAICPEVPGANGYDDGFDPEDYRRRDVVYFQADEDDFDPLTLVASETSMTEQLLADLLVSISVEDHRIEQIKEIAEIADLVA